MIARPDRQRRRLAQTVSAKQAKFLNETQKLRGSGVHRRRQNTITSYCGGRGSGKTVVGARAVIRHAKSDEPWLCLGPTSPMIVQAAYPAFIEECRKLKVLKRAVGGSERRVIFRTRDGGDATLYFKSGFVPESIRGGSYAGLWNDEASFTPQLAFQNAILSLRYKQKQGPIFLTFTPRGRLHWTFETHYKAIEDESILERYAIGRDRDGNLQFNPGMVQFFVDTPYIRQQNTNIIRSASTDSPFLDAKFAQTARKTLSAALFRQEIGGSFEDVAGLLFSRHDFQKVSESEVPETHELEIVRYFDKADNEGSGSMNASALVGKHNATGRVYILSLWFEHMSAAKRNDKIRELLTQDAQRYGHGKVLNYIEREGGSAGKEINRMLINAFQGFPVYEDIVSGGQFRKVLGEKIPGQAKINRALPFAGSVENQNVYIVKTIPKINKALDLITAFPESTLSDVVDALSGAFNKLMVRGRHADMMPQKMSEIQRDTDLMRTLLFFNKNK